MTTAMREGASGKRILSEQYINQLVRTRNVGEAIAYTCQIEYDRLGDRGERTVTLTTTEVTVIASELIRILETFHKT